MNSRFEYFKSRISWGLGFEYSRADRVEPFFENGEGYNIPWDLIVILGPYRFCFTGKIKEAQ